MNFLLAHTISHHINRRRNDHGTTTNNNNDRLNTKVGVNRKELKQQQQQQHQQQQQQQQDRQHQRTDCNVVEDDHNSQEDNHDITISVQENIGKKTTIKQTLSTLLSSIPTRIRSRRTESKTSITIK
jgi:hypothetical protein